MSPDELKSILENSGDLIPSRYQEMLLSVLELDKISIDEVMIPKNEVIGIDLSKDINEIKSFLESLQSLLHRTMRCQSEMIQSTGEIYKKEIME